MAEIDAGFLPLTQLDISRLHSARPRWENPAMDIAGKIRQRLKELGLTSNAASLKAGLPRDAIRDVLSGKSKYPRADTLVAMASALGVTISYLLDDDQESVRSDAMPPARRTLPIRYEVAAGAWLAQDDIRDEPFGFYEAFRIAPYGDFPQWLERVVGDSVNQLIPTGALAHVVDAIAIEYEPKHNDLVVVVRSRAQGAFLERSIKQVELTPRGVELWPRSFNAKWDRPLSLTDGVREGEDAEVAIVGLVLTAYIPFGQNK